MSALSFLQLARQVMDAMDVPPFDIDTHWAVFQDAYDAFNNHATEAEVISKLKQAIAAVES